MSQSFVVGDYYRVTVSNQFRAQSYAAHSMDEVAEVVRAVISDGAFHFNQTMNIEVKREALLTLPGIEDIKFYDPRDENRPQPFIKEKPLSA